MTKILDTCIVQDHYRVTLTDVVRKKLKIEVGDTLAYLENERGDIVVKRAELKV